VLLLVLEVVRAAYAVDLLSMLVESQLNCSSYSLHQILAEIKQLLLHSGTAAAIVMRLSEAPC
jgi:hypothetical protein